MPVIEAFDQAGNLLPDAEARIWATMLVPGGPTDHWWQVHRAACHEADARKRQVRGEHVGELLLVIYQLALHAPDRASHAQADRLIYQSASSFHSKSTFKWSANRRRDCWYEYKAAATIWAAFRYMTRDGLTSMDWEQLLSISELLRAFAEQHRRPVGRTRSGKGDLLLEPGIAWRPPGHARLPSPHFAMEPGPRFTEWLDQA